MKKFSIVKGKVVPLDRPNVDTDAIIPKQFLKRIERTGFGKYLFYNWRYLDGNGHRQNGEFILNHPLLQDASILLARDNFGCGSSREHAPWALADYGFRVIIAPSFADIFANNCIKNGILVIVLPAEQIDDLFFLYNRSIGGTATVDLDSQRILTFENTEIAFHIDEHKRKVLREGLDDIAMTLSHREAIDAFETRHLETNPWLIPQKGA